MNDLIEIIKARVSKNRDLYEKNESAVRELIGLFLNKLGWTTSDPDIVIPNLRTSENKEPDYTLKINDEVVAYIEAKKISTKLKDHIGQLALYCTNQGVEYGILTDGMKWILFKAFEKGKKSLDRIIWEIDFERNSSEEIKSRLNTISFNNFSDLKNLSDKLDKLDESWENIRKNPTKLKTAIVEIIKSDLKQSGYDNDTDELEKYVTDKLAAQSQLFSENEQYDDNFTMNLSTENNKRKKHEKLKVIMSNGQVINDHIANDTFIKVIQKIGIDRVKRLNVKGGSPLISDKAINVGIDKKYKQIPNTSYYIDINHSTDLKKNIWKKLQKCLAKK